MQKTVLRQWPYPFALACGLLIGYLDLHASEVQGTVLVILILTFLFGLIAPRHAWRWALLIGMGVPLINWGALLLGYKIFMTAVPLRLDTLIALIPAFLGAYSGALARKIVHSSRHIPA